MIDLKSYTKIKSFKVPDNNTFDTINASCMLRIADSVELMAVDRVKMEEKITWLKNKQSEFWKMIEGYREDIRKINASKSTYKSLYKKEKAENQKLKAQIEALTTQLSHI